MMKKSELRNFLILCSGLIIFLSFFRKQYDLVNHESAVSPEDVIVKLERSAHDQKMEEVWGYTERVVPLQERRDDSEIRYAAFGSSVTWGAGLDDRDNEAYIRLLSKENGDNYGIRASGPNYPASCISSMLGDKEYDVIILEYFMVQETGMRTLAHRLRERFPDALIFILRNWYPYMLYDQKSNRDLNTFRMDLGFDRDFIQDDNFHKAFLEYGKENFVFRHINWPEKVGYQENVAREIGAYIAPMPFTEEAEGRNGYLELARRYMANDSTHQSAHGHRNMATLVKRTVERVGVPKKPRMGKFTDEDHCYNWLQSGTIGDGLIHSDTFKMVKMPNTEKYALELVEGQQYGWIKVHNPSNHPMRLFIGYMTTLPAPFVYPFVEARLENKEVHVLLEPKAVGYPEDSEVHVPRLVDMGLVDPGVSTIYFKTVEKAERPFRLVQNILTVDKEGLEKLDGGKWMEKAAADLS